MYLNLDTSDVQAKAECDKTRAINQKIAIFRRSQFWIQYFVHFINFFWDLLTFTKKIVLTSVDETFLQFSLENPEVSAKDKKLPLFWDQLPLKKSNKTVWFCVIWSRHWPRLLNWKFRVWRKFIWGVSNLHTLASSINLHYLKADIFDQTQIQLLFG